MSVEVLEFKLRGLSPLVMHNSRLCDPLDPIVVAMKQITSKRNKTDDDLRELADLEWHGSIYTDADGKVCIPGENVDEMLQRAAKKNKRGEAFKAGVLAPGPFTLIYPKPRPIEELAHDPEFVLRRSKCVKRNRVMRTRPIFRTWSVRIEVQIDTSVVNARHVREAVELGGRIIGLGDDRPRYGRFVPE